MDGFGGRQQIGGETRRIDALEKVTGRTKYVPDILLPDLLHARVLRNPYHHARLLSLDVSSALQIRGIVRIITADDIPGINGLLSAKH